MHFLSNLATLVFILIFLLLVAHPRISFAPYIDVFLWVGIMSGCASLINGAGTYTINGILFKCLTAVLAIIFCWQLFKREALGGQHMVPTGERDVEDRKATCKIGSADR